MSTVPSKAEPSEGSTEDQRRAKLERLRAAGIEPYPRAGFPHRDKISKILEGHDPEQLEEGAQAGSPTASLAGWSAAVATARRSSSTSAT